MKWLVIIVPLLLAFMVKAGAQSASYVETPITFAGAGSASRWPGH